eukprot:TRINITY_DN24388_c0_g1_i2.p1 TRINITY_DN24388_c0_g1~~TRINITY_DN24388_c0_g1_i2.p1  ORF type:complete len:177 (-),score=19.44 TRINITY_DN24388_c0_g1_i2:578-1108(-)
MVRDYVVLCHGLVAPARHRSISKALRWTEGNSATLCSTTGRPALTRVTVVAHASRAADRQAFTIVVIRIQTGRRHQIRSHLSHVGHPVVSDGMYAFSSTCRGDNRWCSRNALHRYRIEFRDDSGHPIDCYEKIPEDMTQSLRRLEAKDVVSHETLQRIIGGDLRKWDAYPVLSKSG